MVRKTLFKTLCDSCQDYPNGGEIGLNYGLSKDRWGFLAIEQREGCQWVENYWEETKRH